MKARLIPLISVFVALGMLFAGISLIPNNTQDTNYNQKIGSSIQLSPNVAQASAGSEITKGLNKAANQAGISSNKSLPDFIGGVIKSLLQATGMIFIVIIVYAGIMYMTAAGDEEKVKKAKKMISSTIIGLIIVMGAFAITTFVVESLEGNTAPAQSE